MDPISPSLNMETAYLDGHHAMDEQETEDSLCEFSVWPFASRKRQRLRPRRMAAVPLEDDHPPRRQLSGVSGGELTTTTTTSTSSSTCTQASLENAPATLTPPTSTTNNNNEELVVVPPMDLEREKTRLESLESYVLVSILTASASFSVLESTTAADSVWSTAIVYCAGLSAICGLHATVVFSLCVLYGKTALGRHADAAYSRFLESVAPQRVRGFTSFSASLLLFVVETALLLIQQAPPGNPQTMAAGLALVCTYTICVDWAAVLQAATWHIFAQAVQTPQAQTTAGTEQDHSKTTTTTTPAELAAPPTSSEPHHERCPPPGS